jgi:formylglycine-generating enzyme required for sulfatase activity/predicted Ser/Thr protein kinase
MTSGHSPDLPNGGAGAAGPSEQPADEGGLTELLAPRANEVPTVGPPRPDNLPRPAAVPGYEILGELGRGGMGVVYRARQKTLGRVVALKMILAGGHAGEEDLRRFKAEAEAVACLQHPDIVQVHEVGEAEGRPWFSLEFCPGGSLADLLDGTPWEPARAAQLIETLARAIQHAHEQGILHRDLKPGNILLTADRRPKITDFGLAKRLHAPTSQTQTGTVVGTPSYMAPEQARGEGKEIGPAADVYALGAILYELLTGRAPFRAATPLDTVLQVIHEEPVPPRRLHSKVPRDLETICLKCLHKVSSRRYASARDLADDLQRFLQDEPIRARPTPRWERTVKWGRRRPTAAALLLVCLLASLAGIAALWEFNRQAQANRAAVLVQALLTSDVADVPRRIDALAPYRSWSEPLLMELADSDTADSALRLRASLALAGLEGRHVAYLRQRLLDCSAREFPLVRDRLRPHADEMIAFLAAILHDPGQSARARFHAGLALSDYAPDEVGREEDIDFLAGQLLEASRDDQRDFRQSLRPLADRLLAPLAARFADTRARTTVRLAAADALADLGREQPALLARLASEATPEQYEALLAGLRHIPDATAVRDTLLELVREEPTPALDGTQRVRLGRRRAGAAITLFHLGARESACSIFRPGDDPEALTQFVHGLRARRVGADDLLACLEESADATARFALLLALGEFRPDELPPGRLPELQKKLESWYRSDPRSAIHGACGWLLRSWGLGQTAEAIDRTPLPYDPSGQRDWFVEQVGEDFFTFVVFPPCSFLMGSPESEVYRHGNESRHRVRLTRPFAVCDREVTAGQFERFLKATGTPPPDSEEPGQGADHPVVRVTWAEAVQYCRWLSARAGLEEGQQASESSGAFHPERPGFRLPTEAEWECACRAGTSTAYGFGNDRELLPHYGHFLQTGTAPGRLLRPNLRGLFDMHGNVWEWCHDRYRRLLGDETDPTGPAQGKNRALRGGGWDRSAWHCRSAYRHSPTPDYRGPYMGFRLARTLPAGK